MVSVSPYREPAEVATAPAARDSPWVEREEFVSPWSDGPVEGSLTTFHDDDAPDEDDL